MKTKKAPVITLAVTKGGTGKTSTAAAIAQAARMHEKKVLVIDMDPQANLSAILGADIRKPGAYEVLSGLYAARDAIQATRQGINIMAGKLDLSAITPKRGGAFRLREALEPIRAEYDLVIIDTPPAAGELTYNAMFASDAIIAPVEADTNGLQGIYNLAALADQMQGKGTAPAIRAAIITRYDGRPSINKHMHEVITQKGQETGFPVLGTIRQGVAVRESQAMRENLFTYAKRSRPAADYMALYETLMRRLEKAENE